MVRWRDFASQPPRSSLTRTEIGTITQKGWAGGWQPDKLNTHLSPEELAYILNFTWTEGYGLKSRGGYEKITNDVSGQDEAQQCHIRNVETVASLTAQPSFTQEVLYFNDDDGEVFYATMGDLIEEERDGTGADLVYSTESIGPWDKTTTNYFRTWNIESIVVDDTIYITALRFAGYSDTSTPATHDDNSDGASQPIKYDVLNDTWSRLDPPTFASTTTSGFPSARCAIHAHNRVFAANLYFMSNYRYPNRIYFSDIDETTGAASPESWTDTAYIVVGGDDGSEITNLTQMGDAAIFVAKNNSSYLLLGTNDADFELREVNPRIGATSSAAVVYHDRLIYIFDPSTGLWTYDGTNWENISEPINDTMFETFNYEADFKVNVTAFEHRIFLSVPTGTDTDDTLDHTYVWDTRLKVWTQYDFGIPDELVEYQTDHSYTNVGQPGEGYAYFSTPDGTNKGIFRFDKEFNDDEDAGGDQAVSAEFRTGWMTPGEVGYRHRLRRLDLITSAVSTSDVDIYLNRDFDLTAGWQSDSYDPNNSNLKAYHEQDQGFDHATDMWTWLRMRVVMNDSSQGGDVHGYQMAISSRPWHRGVLGSLNQVADSGGC